MRFYDLRTTVGTSGSPQRIWDARDSAYDEHGAYVPPRAAQVWFSCPETNAGFIVIGGKNVVAAAATRQGSRPIAPGEYLCPLAVGTLDLREVWYDGTVAGDALCVSWQGEPLPEQAL